MGATLFSRSLLLLTLFQSSYIIEPKRGQDQNIRLVGSATLQGHIPTGFEFQIRRAKTDTVHETEVIENHQDTETKKTHR